MKKYLFIAFLPLITSFSTLPTFSQEKTPSYLHIFGYLKNSDNQPSVGSEICERRDGKINSALSCTISQTDGSFSLDVPKTVDNYYTFFSSNSHNEWLATDVPKLQITNLKSASNLTESEIRLGLRLFKPNKTDVDRTLKNGKVELCQIDNPKLCNVINLAFLGNHEGRYELVTPSSAYTISVKLWGNWEWVEWIAIDKNNKQTKSLQVEFGTYYKLVQIKVVSKKVVTNKVLQKRPLMR